MAARFLTIYMVLDRVALSKTEMYRRIKAGTFPKSVSLGPQKVVFLESDIDAWMEAQMERADEGADWRRWRARKAVNARRHREA